MERITVDAYVVDTLMPDLVGHDRHPSAFVLYLRLWRLTGGGRRKSEPVSLRALSEQTGLSKRGVQDAVDRLESRRLIQVERSAPTAMPAFRIFKPWIR